jgi:Cu(I)/Ag(I) efflux system membrane fusion protein
MNKLKLAVAFALVLVVGMALGHWFFSGTEAPSPSDRAGGASGRRVLYWHDPMVPGQRFDKPGKSPFMDMQLVPVYADEAPTGAAVRISSNVAQNLGIRLGKVERRVLAPRLTAVGNVAFDERRLQLVQARTDGFVQRLFVKAPFERVRRGQPLAQIVAPMWLSAQQEYLALLDVKSERGAAIREAARQRLQVLGIPEDSIRELERTRKSGATTTLVSPIDGVVSELIIREGAAVAAGAPLFRINGFDSVWVNAQVPESQIAMIAEGSSVVARAIAWPGAEFTGRVLAVLPNVDAQTRTLPVRIEIQNRERKLSPGMFVSLELTAPTPEPQLSVPTEAVIVTGERSVVIVARGDGVGFDVATVKVGAEVDGHSVVLSGLTEGQPIVLSGQFLIDSEASLTSTLSRLSSSDPVSASAEAPAQTNAHLTQGRITAMKEGELTIAHEAVPSLNWPSMTMPFELPPGKAPTALKVGDRVTFSFVEAKPGAYRIESIAKLEPSQNAAPMEMRP